MEYPKPKELKDCVTVVDIAYIQRYKYLTIQERFNRVFHVHLAKFWSNNITGFDIIAFDEWIEAGNKRLSVVVSEKFGEEGHKIIEELL